jgi:ferredoxin
VSLLAKVRWRVSDRAWRGTWRAIRAAATPFVRDQFDEARAKLAATPVDGVTISRDRLDGWIAAAAPPGVPFQVAVLRGADVRARAGDAPLERRSRHMVGKVRMTPRAIPSESVVVIVLYSDVAADYFVETMAADVATEINRAHGAGVAHADAQASVPVLLKELAVAAGLGTIGKNALFHSDRFGFNCKLNAIFLGAAIDRPDPAPARAGWKLPDCATCDLCVRACPVGAFDDYVISNPVSCDRVISADFFGPRRDHMCRACITRCPVSNDLLKLRRAEGAPQRAFWDNEAQLALAADLFMDRPSLFVWLLQRFYYGAPMPGREAREKKGFSDAVSSAPRVATTDRTRDGWRLLARKK